VSCTLATITLRSLKLTNSKTQKSVNLDIPCLTSNPILTISLVSYSQASMVFAHHSYAIPVYPLLMSDSSSDPVLTYCIKYFSCS
jgi:hypothetical protein